MEAAGACGGQERSLGRLAWGGVSPPTWPEPSPFSRYGAERRGGSGGGEADPVGVTRLPPGSVGSCWQNPSPPAGPHLETRRGKLAFTKCRGCPVEPSSLLTPKTNGRPAGHAGLGRGRAGAHTHPAAGSRAPRPSLPGASGRRPRSGSVSSLPCVSEEGGRDGGCAGAAGRVQVTGLAGRGGQAGRGELHRGHWAGAGGKEPTQPTLRSSCLCLSAPSASPVCMAGLGKGTWGQEGGQPCGMRVEGCVRPRQPAPSCLPTRCPVTQPAWVGVTWKPTKHLPVPPPPDSPPPSPLPPPALPPAWCPEQLVSAHQECFPGPCCWRGHPWGAPTAPLHSHTVPHAARDQSSVYPALRLGPPEEDPRPALSCPCWRGSRATHTRTSKGSREGQLSTRAILFSQPSLP